MKVAILFSGGKDSNFAVLKAKEAGFEVSCLVSVISKNKESYMFHVPNIEWAKLQAEAIGVPIEIFETAGIKEEEITDLQKGLLTVREKYKIEAVVCGALASSYQKDRVDRVCKELGLQSIAPMWGINQLDYIKSVVAAGFKVKFVGAFADGFGPQWLGRELNEETILELETLNKQRGISISGEGGEYETFVYDGPIFKKKINFDETKVIWQQNSGVLDVIKASLAEKP